jgi:hypothetical protein
MDASKKNLVISPELHRRVKAVAVREGRKLQVVVERLLTEALKNGREASK